MRTPRSTRPIPALIVAISVSVAVAAAPVAAAYGQTVAAAAHQTPLVARIMPIAAFAMVGAALGFFVLPFILPSGAAAVAVAGSGTSPLMGAVGAGIGGIVGSRYSE